MTTRDLEECILHGLALDADWVATASAEQLAPFAEQLEAIRDNISRAYDKARNKRLAA